MAKGNLEIRWVHSDIGCNERQRATVRGLGLRKLHQFRTIEDTPSVRGMIAKVAHLVSIVESKTGKKKGIKK